MLPSAMPSRISASQTCAVQLVGQQDHHEVAAAGGLDDRQHLEALLARLGDRGRVLAQPDDDLDAGVLQVEGVGVALRAVADDGDGLAVEEREVCVVVVDHCAAGYPTSRGCRVPRPRETCAQALADATTCARGSRACRRRRCRARSARASDASISSISARRAREHGVVEAAREVERRLPQLLEARVAAHELERLDPHLGEAGLVEQLLRRVPARPARTARAAARRRGPVARRRGRARSARCAGSSAHGLRASESQTASATRPPGRSTRRVSASAAAGSAISM